MVQLLDYPPNRSSIDHIADLESWTTLEKFERFLDQQSSFTKADIRNEWAVMDALIESLMGTVAQLKNDHEEAKREFYLRHSSATAVL